MGGEHKVWVGRLPSDIKEAELRDAFRSVGAVTRIDIKPGGTGGSYSFVHFDDPGAPDNAIRAMDGSTIFGKAIKVSSVNDSRDNDRSDRGKGRGKDDRDRDRRDDRGWDQWREKDWHDKDRTGKGNGRSRDTRHERRRDSRDRDYRGGKGDRKGYDRYDDKGSRTGKGGYDDRRDRHWDDHDDEGKGKGKGGKGGGKDRDKFCEGRIWVGGLPEDITHRELSREFNRFGDALEISIRTSNKDTFAFVQFPRQRQADDAMREMDQSRCFGAKIKVNSANAALKTITRNFEKGDGRGEGADRSRSRHRSLDRRSGERDASRHRSLSRRHSPEGSGPGRDLGRIRKAKESLGAAAFADRGHASVEEVEDFIVDSLLDERAQQALRDLAPHLQSVVIAGGSLSDARNPSAACLGRIRDAQLGRSLRRPKGSSKGGANGDDRSANFVPDSRLTHLVLLRNLPLDMKQDELEDVCGDFGRVVSAKLWDSDDGECQDGHVEFVNLAAAKQAIEELDGRRMEGWEMRMRAHLKK